MPETTLRKSVYLKAAPQEVWAFLTDPEKMAVWFHRPDHALTEGAEFAMKKQSDGTSFMSGKVLSAQPFSRLEHTFCLPQMGDTVSNVVWSLREVPGGTELSLCHTGLPQGESAFGLLLNLDKGWEEHMHRMRVALNETIPA